MIFFATLWEDTGDIKKQGNRELQQKIRDNQSSKRKSDVAINPHLECHKVYNTDGILEHHRINFSRFRLSSHRLKIETGRWSRIPRENRTCKCNNTNIEDEEHVALLCPLSEHLREKHNIQYDTLEHLFKYTEPNEI